MFILSRGSGTGSRLGLLEAAPSVVVSSIDPVRDRDAVVAAGA